MKGWEIVEKFDKNYFNKATTKEESIFAKYANFLRKEGIDTDKLLLCDIGCATGNFISCINNPKKTYGIDSSSYAIESCKKKFNTSINNFAVLDLNKAEQLPFNKFFDLITMFDVIEHIDNLANLKKILRSSLKNGGYLLITTPNANNFVRFFKKQLFTGEIDQTHVNLFTPYTLDFFLRKAGFRQVVLFTPYNFYFKNNWITKKLLYGGQVVAIYKWKK